MTTRSGKSDYLQAVTMIDPAISQIDIRRILFAWVDLAVNQVKPDNKISLGLTDIFQSTLLKL